MAWEGPCSFVSVADLSIPNISGHILQSTVIFWKSNQLRCMQICRRAHPWCSPLPGRAAPHCKRSGWITGWWHPVGFDMTAVSHLTIYLAWGCPKHSQVASSHVGGLLSGALWKWRWMPQTKKLLTPFARSTSSVMDVASADLNAILHCFPLGSAGWRRCVLQDTPGPFHAPHCKAISRTKRLHVPPSSECPC